MPGADEEDQVSAADQEKINKFSRLNARLHEIEEDLQLQRKGVEELDDLTDELCLLDDDEPIKYHFGECFFDVEKSKAEALLEELQEQKKATLSASEDELAQIQQTLKELKTQLYAKFGSNINLEE